MLFRRKPRTQPAPLKPIEGATLEWVVGGRLLMRSGPSPEVLNGLKTLVETVGAAGQVMQQKDAERQAQMGQLMQQMMARRG